MIINGCIAVGDAESIYEDVLTEIFKELGFEDDVENEELAIVGGTYTVYDIQGCDDDFNIVSKDEEYRCIHENDIHDIFRNEAEDVYNEDQWREEVANNATTDGYDDWFGEVLDNADYGSFFGSHDGSEEQFGKHYVFRTG